jgi:hypothetical protein
LAQLLASPSYHVFQMRGREGEREGGGRVGCACVCVYNRSVASMARVCVCIPARCHQKPRVCVCVCVCVHIRRVSSKASSLCVCVCVCVCMCVYPQGVINSSFSNGLHINEIIIYTQVLLHRKLLFTHTRRVSSIALSATASIPAPPVPFDTSQCNCKLVSPCEI